MREKALHLLGLMRRADAIAVGETNTGAAARSGKAKLLLLAADASGNARKRAEGFAAGKGLFVVTLPFTKEELSAGLGLPGCSMAALLDSGFAAALMKLLCRLDPERYGQAAREAERLDNRSRRRREEAAAHERNKRIGKRRNNV